MHAFNYYQNRCPTIIQICNIFHNMTAAPRRTSQTQMADINSQLANQNDTLRNMLKVANQTDATTNNIQAQLKRQREVLQNNVEKNKQIKHEVKKADKKTAEMRRRNLCVKGVLWIVILLLFATNIGLIIWKATGKSPI